MRRRGVSPVKVAEGEGEFFEKKYVLRGGVFFDREGSFDSRDCVAKTWVYVEIRLKYLKFLRSRLRRSRYCRYTFWQGTRQKTSVCEPVRFAQYKYFRLKLAILPEFT